MEHENSGRIANRTADGIIRSFLELIPTYSRKLELTRIEVPKILSQFFISILIGTFIVLQGFFMSFEHILRHKNRRFGPQSKGNRIAGAGINYNYLIIALQKYFREKRVVFKVP